MASLGHPCKFQRVSRLGTVIARQSSSERQPNFAALNIGRHLYSTGRPSRWALAHILVSIFLLLMAALRSRCGHYIFVLFLLSSFFFSSPNLSGRRLDVYHTSKRGVALMRI